MCPSPYIHPINDIQTCMHANIHLCIHTYIHTCMHACVSQYVFIHPASLEHTLQGFYFLFYHGQFSQPKQKSKIITRIDNLLLQISLVFKRRKNHQKLDKIFFFSNFRRKCCYIFYYHFCCVSQGSLLSLFLMFGLFSNTLFKINAKSILE